MKSPLVRALGWLSICAALPVTQIALLHFAFHQRFGRNNIVLGNYSWDILPLLGCAVAYAFVHFYTRGFFQPRFSSRMLAAFFALGFFSLAWMHGYGFLVRTLGAGVATATLLAASSGCFFAGSLIFLDPRGQWRTLLRTQATRLIFATVGFAALALLPLVQEYCWRLLSSVTGILAFALVKLTGTAIELHVSPYITLQNPFFLADIKQPCSGLEGISYFFFLYAFVRVLEGFSFRPWKEVQLGLLGLAVVLFLNALRIASLFVVAVNARRYLTSRKVSEAFVWAFHSNAGWILYLVGVLLFFRLVFRLRPSTSIQTTNGVN